MVRRLEQRYDDLHWAASDLLGKLLGTDVEDDPSTRPAIQRLRQELDAGTAEAQEEEAAGS